MALKPRSDEREKKYCPYKMLCPAAVGSRAVNRTTYPLRWLDVVQGGRQTAHKYSQTEQTHRLRFLFVSTVRSATT